MNSGYVLKCENLTKVYTQEADELLVLDGIDLLVGAGETVSITGSSGSGKSTLLHILAGLDTDASGEISINGNSLTGLNDSGLCKLRNKNLGFIYQFHHLLPEFTAVENVLMPLIIAGLGIGKADKDNAHDLLNKLGLINRANHYPSQLSGGERQRVAIARAIINQPKLIFADEPTGNLDNTTSNQVLEVFFRLQKEFNTSLVMVTHDIDIANKTQTMYRLHNGKLERTTTDGSLHQIARAT